MKRIKMLHVSHSIDNAGKYERSGTSRVFKNLNCIFDITHTYFSYDEDDEYFKSTDIIAFQLRKGMLSKAMNIVRMYYNNYKVIKFNESDIIWIGATAGYNNMFLFIYKFLFPKKIFFIQLFTPAVTGKKWRRNLLNYILGINLRFFNHIGSGTDDNIAAFRLSKKKITFTDPGYNDYGYQQKSFKHMNLVYLGTLQGRRVEDTIAGLKLFWDKMHQVLTERGINISYDIIGGGKAAEVGALKDAINQTGLNETVTYHGYLDDKSVMEVFKKVNIGIAYLPKTDFYVNLPSTKIIEYFLSGMAVISVDTNYAKSILNPEYGTLCTDTPQSFALALEMMVEKLTHLNSQEIRNSYKQYSMSEMIKNDYAPKLRKLKK
jgi:glycosyltransferase involved in cell wall biosynthesis